MIKHLFFLLCIAACTFQSGAQSRLSGKFEQLPKSKVITVNFPKTPLNSIVFTIPIQEDGTFSWEGNVPEGKMLVLELEDDYITIPWYAENQDYRLEKFGENYYLISTLKESLQNRFVEFRKEQERREETYNNECWGYDTITDMEKKTLFSDRLSKKFKDNCEYMLSGIQQFAGTQIGDFMADEKLYILEVDFHYFTRVMQILDGRMTESPMKERLVKTYAVLKEKQLTGIAPDFELPDMQGTLVRLSSFRGKYVLVDFWASWCAPCRKKNKELNREYPELQKAGLEVISVSLDHKKELWLQALKEDQVQWIQLIDERGFNQSSVRAAYKVEQIPTVYLIGPDGNILLKNAELQEIYNIIKQNES